MCHVALPYRGNLQGNFTLGANCPHRNYLCLENFLRIECLIVYNTLRGGSRGVERMNNFSDSFEDLIFHHDHYHNNYDNDGDEIVHISIHCHTHCSLHYSKGGRIVIIFKNYYNYHQTFWIENWYLHRLCDLLLILKY